MNTDSDQVEHSFKNKRGRMKRGIVRELFPSINDNYEQRKGKGPTGMMLNTRCPKGWYSDNEEERLQDKNDDEDQIEGYSSENDKGSLYRLTGSNLMTPQGIK